MVKKSSFRPKISHFKDQTNKWLIQEPKKELLEFLQELYRGSSTLNSLDVIRVLNLNISHNQRYAKAVSRLTREEISEVFYEFGKWLVSPAQQMISDKKTHELKIAPEYYEAILKREKRFEIRRNDRDYQQGDFLSLNEYEADKEIYTGRQIEVRITYITDFAQQENYVVLGIEI